MRPSVPFYIRISAIDMHRMKRKKRNVRKPAPVLEGSFKNETGRTIREILVPAK